MGRAARQRQAAERGRLYRTVDVERLTRPHEAQGMVLPGDAYGFYGPLGVVVGFTDHPSDFHLTRLTVRLGPEAIRFFAEQEAELAAALAAQPKPEPDPDAGKRLRLAMSPFRFDELLEATALGGTHADDLLKSWIGDENYARISKVGHANGKLPITKRDGLDQVLVEEW